MPSDVCLSNGSRSLHHSGITSGSSDLDLQGEKNRQKRAPSLLVRKYFKYILSSVLSLNLKKKPIISFIRVHHMSKSTPNLRTKTAMFQL